MAFNSLRKRILALVATAAVASVALSGCAATESASESDFAERQFRPLAQLDYPPELFPEDLEGPQLLVLVPAWVSWWGFVTVATFFPVSLIAIFVRKRPVVIACLIWLIALYPLSAFRAMNKAAENVYTAIRRDGTQQNVLDTMQTRAELYDRIDYHRYEQKLDALFATKGRESVLGTYDIDDGGFGIRRCVSGLFVRMQRIYGTGFCQIPSRRRPRQTPLFKSGRYLSHSRIPSHLPHVLHPGSDPRNFLEALRCNGSIGCARRISRNHYGWRRSPYFGKLERLVCDSVSRHDEYHTEDN